MPKLRILNVSINRLDTLPRGFGAFPVIEVLDLSYNNLNENTLPGNFFMMETLRALYLGDNDFEYLPKEVGQLKNLQIVSFPPEKYNISFIQLILGEILLKT